MADMDIRYGISKARQVPYWMLYDVEVAGHLFAYFYF